MQRIQPRTLTNRELINYCADAVDDPFGMPKEWQKEAEALKVDAEIGRELYRAAGELPEWFNVVVDMERGAATVKWYDSDGNDYEIDGADRSLAEQIKDAVDSAIEQDAARGEK